MTVVAAILAAGGSRRLGRPKQLLSLGGEPLLRQIARRVLAARGPRVAVVVGAAADPVIAAIADLDVTVLVNPAWPDGAASSLRAAIGWAIDQPCTGALLLACDQPRLSTDHVDALIAAHHAGGGTIASAYGGVLGVPALFERAAFPRLLAVRGDQGARALLRAGDHPVTAIAWPAGAIDLDTPDDVRRARRAAARGTRSATSRSSRGTRDRTSAGPRSRSGTRSRRR